MIIKKFEIIKRIFFFFEEKSSYQYILFSKNEKI